MPRNLHFCSFASFLIVSLTPFVNKPDYFRDLTIFIISSITSFELIKVVIQDHQIFYVFQSFLCTPPTAAVNLNGIKTLLGNSLSIFLKINHALVMVKAVYLSYPPTSLLNPPNCSIYAVEFLINLY